ncbi:hypothetical protein B0H14DRAFT_172864 [Mycena olivaceomarginata]|nr:hypothetical protein B0H14DRAFT_172864 [Mycena olivaceomarginata]
MAPAQLSCLDPICALLVKRTSGDMIISGRVYVFGNDLLDVCATLCTVPPPLADVLLYILPLAPTTPALTAGNPVRVRLRWRPPSNLQPRSSRPRPRSQAQWCFVVANRHPKPKETASIPALTSTSTADDRISSSPYAIQVYPRIRSSRTPPRPPPVHAAALAGFGAYVTIHRIPPFIGRALPSRTSTVGRSRCASRRRTRCSRRCTHPALQLGGRGRGGLAPQDNARTGGVWLGLTRRTHPSIHPAPSPEPPRDLCPARGGDAPRALRAPTHPLLRRSRVFLDSRRSDR